MRLFVVAATFVALLGGCSHACSPSHERLAYELSDETVALVDADDQHVFCSGVWVSTHEILTAQHCVDDSEPGDTVDYAVQDDLTIAPDGETNVASREAVLSAVDKDHDLALLYVADPPLHHTALLSRDEIRPGQPTFCVSNPLGLGWSYSSGEVAQIRFLGDTGGTSEWYVQTTAPVSPGSSGSGLFDANGRLIGIARMVVTAGQNLNLFVHRDHVLAFMTNAHAGARGLP